MVESIALKPERKSASGARESGSKYEPTLRNKLHAHFRGLGIRTSGLIHERGLMGTCTRYILEEAYPMKVTDDRVRLKRDMKNANKRVITSKEPNKPLQDAYEDRLHALRTV